MKVITIHDIDYYQAEEVDNKIDELKAEVDTDNINLCNYFDQVAELAAHVERLTRHWFSGRKKTTHWYETGNKIYSETPEQSLTKRDKKVGADAIEKMMYKIPDDGEGRVSIDAIADYEEQLRSE